MTDPNQAPSDDPFQQIFAEKSDEPAGNDNDADNPFAAIMPKPVGASQQSGALGAGLRSAERSALPAIGSLPAIGAGAELGAAAGALGGLAAPITVPLGGLIGGVAGAIGGSYVIGKAQNWALSKLPDSWKEAIGQDERQQQIDLGEHPTAAFLGGLVPYALTMRPGAITKQVLPENATALQRIMANPATARVFGGSIMGGMELGQEALSGERPNVSRN